MGWYGGGFGWLLMGLMLLAFWALLIFGGVALYRSSTRGQDTGSSGPATAERLLDERFARGEIDVDEYTQRRGLLRSGRRQ